MIPTPIKWITVIIAMLSPFIMIGWLGEMKSVSAYWNTAAQPLFIFMNATTSYFLFTTHHWQFPAVLLLLVTAFSVATYPILHNIFAVTFFAVCVWSLWQLHKFRWYIIPYILAGALTAHKLLYGEVLAITIICVYHIHIMLYVYFLRKNH
jgi:hypothetical protein